jgi:hypothetical protein
MFSIGMLRCSFAFAYAKSFAKQLSQLYAARGASVN